MKNPVLKLALMGLAVGSVMSSCTNSGDNSSNSEKSDCKTQSKCKGQNGCTGKSDCTGSSGCKGDNGCTGKSDCTGSSGCSSSRNERSLPSLELKAKRELAAKELTKIHGLEDS